MNFAVPESQRESITQPRVAEPARLPWGRRRVVSQPQRGCVHRVPPIRPNPVGVAGVLASLTQGSSFLATLGWRPLPRRGKTPQERTALGRQIAATDTQIARLIHDLHRLTEEEIRILEGRQ